MARKTQYLSDEKGAEISELLDTLEQLIERTKVLYEQYFMGIQKVAPGQLHRDIERKIREVTQMQVRNTGLRYRLNTLTQKFGVYNTYWRRVMREIEQGRYVRDIARASRKAISQGDDIPDEILMSIPKRIRERILEDREALANRAALGEEHSADHAEELPSQPEHVRTPKKRVHAVGAELFDADIDALFDALTRDAEQVLDSSASQNQRAESQRPPSPPTDRGKPISRANPGPERVPNAATSGPSQPPSSHQQQPPPAQPLGAMTSEPRGRGKLPPPPIPRLPDTQLPPGMSAAESRDIYTQYIKARKQVGASTNIPYERLMQTLNEQAPQILKQHNAAGVEFRVEVKDDKVILKAKPKKP